jgi:hypothetical protein
MEVVVAQTVRQEQHLRWRWTPVRAIQCAPDVVAPEMEAAERALWMLCLPRHSSHERSEGSSAVPPRACKAHFVQPKILKIL